jgi:hypothetical protein
VLKIVPLQEFPFAAPGLRDAWLPTTEAGADEIGKQLDRLLASAVFRNSKRCSDLLAYVVRRALSDGEAGHLKERTIGIEVFGRAPDYDTTADHVVRSVAGEVRKRLAQYYMEPGHADQIRIEIPSGSYAVRFRLPEKLPLHEPADILVSVPDESPRASEGPRRRLGVNALTISAAAAILAVLGIGALLAERSTGSLDKFWGPVLSSQNPILICVGNRDQPDQAASTALPMTLRDFHALNSQKVFLDDAITLARVTGLLQQKGRRFRIVSHAAVTFADLQGSPAVLIGRRSNDWTDSLVSHLRFSIEPGTVPHVMVIRDKKNPSRHDWSVDASVPWLQNTKDYALVVRALNPKTSQIEVMATGLTAYGTLAAGEFLTDPVQLQKLEAFAPASWEHKNLAVVLSADIINASVGAPNVVAADFW